MAFHQNGLTMTFFARDYTTQSVTGLDRIGFDVWNLVLLIIVVYGAFSLFQSKTGRGKAIAGVAVLASLGINMELFFHGFDSGNTSSNLPAI